MVVFGLQYNFFPSPFFDHSMHSALPLGIYLATKFWMYVTWFFWFWNDLSFLSIHLPFLANSVALFYNFGKSWKSDPGIIKATEEQKKKVVMYLLSCQFTNVYSRESDGGADTLRLLTVQAELCAHLYVMWCSAWCLVMPRFSFSFPFLYQRCSGDFQR